MTQPRPRGHCDSGSTLRWPKTAVVKWWLNWSGQDR